MNQSTDAKGKPSARPPVSSVRLRTPDDWHLHLRDGAMMKAVLPYTARRFARAIVMPNLVPPVVTAADAKAYRARIVAALPEDARGFQPLMTAYLTEGTDPADLAAGFADRILTAVKLYPAHATTNAAHGVNDLARVRTVFATMEKIGMPLLIHGEVTDPAVDIFDREAVFIERHLEPLLKDHPGLKVVLEHITTADAADFVRANARKHKLAATITAHHLLINRNAIFQGGLRPHAYCLPVAKRERHRKAVLAAAVSGNPAFFLGTDSAPHPKAAKESACGCAGLFTAPHALELYAEAFDGEGALDRLEAFASEFGPRFYGLPLNSGAIVLERVDEKVPDVIPCPGAEGPVVPFRAAGSVSWRFQGVSSYA